MPQLKGFWFMKKDNLALNRLMLKYFLEILVVVVFVTVSYTCFTSKSISYATSVAKSYDNDNRPLQVSLGSTESDIERLLKVENVVDSKELSIKNTNNKETYIDVIIKLKEKCGNGIQISINGNILDLNTFIQQDEYYVSTVYSNKIKPYEMVKVPITILGDPLDYQPIDYLFEVNESYYS